LFFNGAMKTLLFRLETAMCHHHIELYELLTSRTSSCTTWTHFARFCMKNVHRVQILVLVVQLPRLHNYSRVLKLNACPGPPLHHFLAYGERSSPSSPNITKVQRFFWTWWQHHLTYISNGSVNKR
jgi:hypothetical protein